MTEMTDYTYDAEQFKETFEREFTWIAGFMRNVRRFGKKTALIDPALSKSWTYEELNADSNRLAHALQKDGVGRGSVVMMQLFNSPQFCFGYLASHKIGAVCNPVNFQLSPGETAEIMEHNKPKVFLYDTDIMATACQALNISRHQPEIILAVRGVHGAAALPEGHIDYETYVGGCPDREPETDFEPNIYRESLRLQTSGTTATPKGVPFNQINEVFSAHNLIIDLGLTSRDITMNLTPWFHRGGIHTTGPATIFYIGGTTVILRAFSPNPAVKYITEYQITYLTAVPAVLHLLCTALERYPADVSCLKGILSMGAPLEKEACIRFMRLLTPNIYNGYGTTESLCNLFLYPWDLPEMSGYTGRACVDDEVRIIKYYDDRRAEPEEVAAADGKEIGEVIIKCPAKSAYCYAGNPEVTREKFYKGWLYTGDLGTWDAAHYVKIAGRKDDMIICMGENIYPARIEEVINKHPKVEECIVTSVSDKRKGEIVVAFVIPKDASLTISELVEYCGSSPHLSAYQVPKYYRLVDRLPQTATGKKQHYIARQQAQQDFEAGRMKRK